jgi:hypothetical protein
MMFKAKNLNPTSTIESSIKFFTKARLSFFPQGSLQMVGWNGII